MWWNLFIFIRIQSSKSGKHVLVGLSFPRPPKLGLSGLVYNKSFVSFSVVFSFRMKAAHITGSPSPLTDFLPAFISAVANVTSRQPLKSGVGRTRAAQLLNCTDTRTRLQKPQFQHQIGFRSPCLRQQR